MTFLRLVPAINHEPLTIHLQPLTISPLCEILAGLPEHRMEHRLGQFAGKGVLLTGVVGPNQSDVPGKPVQGTVAEGRNG